MALRSSWKGFLKLSLVSVPVRAFTASESGSEIRLNQLNRHTNNRIQYKKVDPDHGEVAKEDIISGYEYSKGQYVIIEEEEIEKLRTKNDHAVQIEGFMPADTLDPIYHAGKTYYLLPDGAAGQKPYALLREGMLDAGVVALAKVVIARREQLVMVRQMDGLLVMTVLSHHGKVKEADIFKEELEEQELTKEELSLTKTLIEASRIKDFSYENYPDEYVARLNSLIEKKIAGQEIVQVADPEEPKIINLMDALKKSVAEAQALAAGGGGGADIQSNTSTLRKAGGKKKPKADDAKPVVSQRTKKPAKKKAASS